MQDAPPQQAVAPPQAWRIVLQYTWSDGIPRRSMVVAAIVGAILNLINQGDALLGLKPLSPTKLVLTYLVPYCVCTYGAVSYRLQADRAGSHDR